MNELQIFTSEEFGNVRTLVIDSEPYFVGIDIANILGYSNASKAVSTHVDEEDRRKEMMAHSQNGNVVTETTIVNESGLYSLVLSSKLPNAKKFKRWVTSEVLPAIRKHGMYAVDKLVNNPDLLIKVATELKQEREQNARLTKKIEEQKPLVEFANHVSESVDTIDMEEMAKIVDSEIIPMGRNRLIKWLKEQKILKSNRVPYQEYLDRGYFEVVEVTKDTCYGQRTFLKTVVTGKGQIWVLEKLRKEKCA